MLLPHALQCVHIENLLSTGVCMVVEQLLASVGLPNAPPVAAAPLNHVGEYSINAPRSGVLADHEFLKVGAGRWLGQSGPVVSLECALADRMPLLPCAPVVLPTTRPCLPRAILSACLQKWWVSS